MVLTIEQRIFLLINVIRNDEKFTDTVKHEFMERFPGGQVPHRNAVRNLIAKFRKTGSVADASKSGRPSNLGGKIVHIQDILKKNPIQSIRRLSQQAHVSKSSAQRILRKKLDLYPYKMTTVHQLKESDHNSRIDYCNWFQNVLMREDEDILDVTYFTDEAWFHLSGYVNSQNSRIWSTKNPHEFKQIPLHDQKVGVWCALSRTRIIGPIFFDNTINAKRYRTEILEPFIAQLKKRELKKAWFQQDGASAHTARTSLQYLEEVFGNRIISRGIWPPRSPDLTPLDFYLWGALKGRAYENNPQTVDDLKTAISQNIKMITPSTLQKVSDNMKRRVNICQQASGTHFQHLL